MTSSEVAKTGEVSLLEVRMNPEKYRRLRTYPRAAAVVEMSKIVAQAYLYRGLTADPTNIQYIACALVDELTADAERLGTGSLTFIEIGRAVKRAALTEEMYGISVSSLYRAVIGYVKGEGHRLAVIANHRRALAAPERKPDGRVERAAEQLARKYTAR